MSNLFDYLLNAFEEASQSPTPASMGYGEKRRKLIEYVRELERKVTITRPEALSAEDDRLEIALRLLAETRQFITGDLNLQCIAGESDRACMNRSKAELLSKIDYVSIAPSPLASTSKDKP